jgi:hypothetical protein
MKQYDCLNEGVIESLANKSQRYEQIQKLNRFLLILGDCFQVFLVNLDFLQYKVSTL